MMISAFIKSLSRSADVPTRKRYVALVESVKEGGGTIKVFSSLHVSGEREQPFIFRDNKFSVFSFSSELGQLSGVAAILRFPLPQLDEDSDDSDTQD